MRQGTNSDIDLLLRRLSPREDTSQPHADGQHLDADELNSYAENAVPAAARGRYTEHLAECANCRKLVAQLSSSAGVVAVAEHAKVSAPSAFRKFLAGLFSPLVLRYAVPALGLLIVAVIGLTILRRNERTPEVAQLQEAKQNQAPAEQPGPVQSPSPETSNAAQQKAQSPVPATATHEDKAKETAPAPPNAPPSVSAVSADVKQPAATPKPEQQVAANEAASPKPAEQPPKRVEIQGTAAPRSTIAPASEVSRGQPYEGSKVDNRRLDDVSAARSAPARRSEGASIAKVRRDAPAAGAAAEEKDKNSAETRAVAGRRFRKERGMWIDTAYDSGRSTTNVSRGSEQYRALVADEPAIKTIAEQLDGEIIVVWKGRAYRIQ